jgi:hypothetical protein
MAATLRGVVTVARTYSYVKTNPKPTWKLSRLRVELGRSRTSVTVHESRYTTKAM